MAAGQSGQIGGLAPLCVMPKTNVLAIEPAPTPVQPMAANNAPLTEQKTLKNNFVQTIHAPNGLTGAHGHPVIKPVAKVNKNVQENVETTTPTLDLIAIDLKKAPKIAESVK